MAAGGVRGGGGAGGGEGGAGRGGGGRGRAGGGGREGGGGGGLRVETDARYLTAMPHRGNPNEPAFVRNTAEFAAQEVFGVPFEELASTTTVNARRFFGLR